MSVALEITADLPDEEEMDRWLGEPIKVVYISMAIRI